MAEWFTVFGEDIPIVMLTEPDDEDFLIEFNGRIIPLEDLLVEIME